MSLALNTIQRLFVVVVQPNADVVETEVNNEVWTLKNFNSESQKTWFRNFGLVAFVLKLVYFNVSSFIIDVYFVSTEQISDDFFFTLLLLLALSLFDVSFSAIKKKKKKKITKKKQKKEKIFGLIPWFPNWMTHSKCL